MILVYFCRLGTLFFRLESKFYWTGLDRIIYGMEKGTCHGIANALDYIKDENNDLLDILFDHLVFI